MLLRGPSSSSPLVPLGPAGPAFPGTPGEPRSPVNSKDTSLRKRQPEEFHLSVSALRKTVLTLPSQLRYPQDHGPGTQPKGDSRQRGQSTHSHPVPTGRHAKPGAPGNHQRSGSRPPQCSSPGPGHRHRAPPSTWGPGTKSTSSETLSHRSLWPIGSGREEGPCPVLSPGCRGGLV